VTRQHVVEEDVANCKQEKQEVCLERDGCPTIPKTICSIITKNVTKDFTDTQVPTFYIVYIKFLLLSLTRGLTFF